MTARLDKVGDASGLHDQNFIFNGKKLVNPLDYHARVSQLGRDICALEHLRLIYTKYTYDQHGLKLEDARNVIVRIGLQHREFVNKRQKPLWHFFKLLLRYIRNVPLGPRCICKFVEIILIFSCPPGMI